MGIDQVAFWDERASLGEYAGTRDRILKQLEIEAIARYLKGGMYVLDAGCGDGETAIELAKRYRLSIVGIDQSEKMIRRAQSNPEGERIFFLTRNLVDWPGEDRLLVGFRHGYDVVYTERVIINLPDWDEQLRAIQHLISLLKPGGVYVMCEACQDGLDRINELRSLLGLPAIAPPEHNRYLRNNEIWEAHDKKQLPRPFENDFTSTYYLLSRVVNASLSQQDGKEPDYESPINKLGLILPPLVYGLGQTRIWTFRREE